MFQDFGMLLEAAEHSLKIIPSTPHLFAQTAPADPFVLAFLSGPQFFIALIAGVVMAFAFQFVLSNLSVAVGISGGINPADTDTKGWGKKVRRIEAKVGSATLFIVNTALFIACFLAVKLTIIQDSGLAAIVSVVIWSVYFLLLLWGSSQAIGSLVGAVGNTASSSVQGVMGMVATALSGRTASSQITDTVEASVAAVTQEVRSTLSTDQLRENLEDYVSQLKLPQPDLSNFKDIPSQALNLLSNANLPSVRPTVNSSELFNLMQTATSEDLASGRLRQQLTQMLGLSKAPNGNGHSQENDEAQGGDREGQTKQGIGLQERGLRLGTEALLAALAGRSGLSGSALENLSKSLGSLGQQLGNQASQAVDSIHQSSRMQSSVIRSDVEAYLLNSPSWYLRPEGLDHGFREVLYDPEADAELVQQQLAQLNRADFVKILNRREGITSPQVNDLADQLELVRREVLDTVRTAAEQARSQHLRHRVETYLQSAPKESLTSDQVQQDFTAVLADPEATYETLGNRLLQFDRDTLMQLLLAGRQDLNPEETEQILNQLEGARDRFLNQSQETWNQLQSQAGEFRQQVETYLRETDLAELTPDRIRQTLQLLLEAPNGGLLALRTGLNQLNRETLTQVLSQRQDISEDQINQLIEQVEAIRDGILHGPQALTEEAKEQVERLTHQIADYLRQTNLEELNPEGIQRDLQTLLADPQLGVSALGSRLTHVDRDTLVQLLSQGENLSEEQVNRAIDQTLKAIRAIARPPQQFAQRTRDRVRDFQAELADYLRNTNREELNPKGIQRDLQLLIQRPQVGAEQLGDRLSHINRDTLIALLAQREDLDEEDANRIVGQIEAVRDRLIQQAQKATEQVQQTATQAAEQTRQYLQQVEQQYKGIQRDLRKLFDDPEAGFDALRDRLSQFDRDTLVSILSSRTDLSEEQANQLVEQIEAARDSVLQQAERLQAKAEEQIKALKHQAKEQAEEVQKIAASAAWWLFGTAITSVTTAAIAGILASGGLSWLD